LEPVPEIRSFDYHEPGARQGARLVEGVSPSGRSLPASSKLTRGMTVFREYLRTFRQPATMHAICEDYRAAASIDLDHDKVDLDKKIVARCSCCGQRKGRSIACTTFCKRGRIAPPSRRSDADRPNAPKHLQRNNPHDRQPFLNKDPGTNPQVNKMGASSEFDSEIGRRPHYPGVALIPYRRVRL